jgi:hypothetical protein
MHETSSETELPAVEVPKEETPEEDTAIKEEGRTVKTHDSIDETTNSSLPPAYPVTTSGHSNLPEYSEAAHHCDEEEENLNTEDEPKKADDLSSNPAERDHVYTCPACLGEYPKLLTSDAASTTLYTLEQGESLKMAEDKVLGGGKKTLDCSAIEFKACRSCKADGAPDFMLHVKTDVEESGESDVEKHEFWNEFVGEKKKTRAKQGFHGLSMLDGDCFLEKDDGEEEYEID